MYVKHNYISKLENASNTLNKSIFRTAKYLVNTGDDEENARKVDLFNNYYNLDDILALSQTDNIYQNWTADMLNAIENTLADWSPYQAGTTLAGNNYRNGYKAWNTAFNATGMNTYFGSDENKFDDLGPTTWNRKLMYDKLKSTYNSSDKAITTNNGKLYFNGTSWVNVPKRTAIEFPVAPAEPAKSREINLSWLPMLMLSMTEGISAINSYNLARQLKVPTVTPVRQEAKTTDNYLLGLQYQQAAAETRARGNLWLTSDLGANLQQRLSYEAQAQALEEKGDLAQAQARAQSDQAVQAAKLATDTEAIKAGNTNRLNFVALDNAMLTADDARQKTLATIGSNLIGNIATDTIQHVQTLRINDAYQQQILAGLDATKQTRQLYNAYNALWSDPTTSLEYAEFAAFVQDPNNSSKFGVYPTDPNSQEYKDWVLEQWNSNPASEPFKSKYEKAKLAALDNFYLQAQNLKEEAAYKGADHKYLFDGSTLNLPYNRYNRQLSPAFKSGGKASKLIDYTKSILKEQQQFRKEQNDSNRRSTEHLNKQLDRLNREQIALLRAVFK